MASRLFESAVHAFSKVVSNMLDVSFAGVLTTEAVEATFDALAAVHDCGLLNEDIRCPNFLVDNRAHQGVGLIHH